ncbi:hypothetical protein VPHD148_0041 [Vibrio phage D148]
MSDDIEYECMWEKREAADHALIRNYRGESLYERPRSRPITPRKAWKCDACEKTIKVGEDVKFSLKAYGGDGDWPTTNICGLCYTEDPSVQVALERIYSGEFDI